MRCESFVEIFINFSDLSVISITKQIGLIYIRLMKSYYVLLLHSFLRSKTILFSFMADYSCDSGLSFLNIDNYFFVASIKNILAE
jgi:hypothetical protein